MTTDHMSKMSNNTTTHLLGQNCWHHHIIAENIPNGVRGLREKRVALAGEIGLAEEKVGLMEERVDQ